MRRLRDEEKFASKCATIMRPKWASKIIPITFVLFGAGFAWNYPDLAPGHTSQNMKIIYELF